MTLRGPSFTGTTRRTLLRCSALAGSALAVGMLRPARGFARQGPAVITSDSVRPVLPSGVQSGDLAGDRAILWARADRPARMMVDWATTESFTDAKTVAGPAALEDSDLTAKLDLAGLPAGQKIHYRVRFVDLADPALASEPVAGSFWTPPAARRNLRFVWSGDTAGQGWGINLDWGGMKIYEAMRALEPAFFIHWAIPSTPTGRSRPSRRRPTAGSGRTSPRPRSRRWPRRSPSSAATTPTTSWTRTSGASTPRCRCWRSGTTTRSPTTGTPARTSRGSAQGRVQGDQRRSVERAGRAGVLRLHADPRPPARGQAVLRQLPLRPLARGVPDRHALLPWSQQHERPDRARAPRRGSSAPSRSAG